MEEKHTKLLKGLAYGYLARRARTEQEVRVYLLAKAETLHIAQELIDPVIAHLKEHKYINDAHFVESYVSYRLATKPKSAYALRQELKKRGVSTEALDENLSSQTIDEEGLAKQALSSYWRRIENLDPTARIRRAISFLQRRGFSYSIAKEVTQTQISNNT